MFKIKLTKREEKTKQKGSKSKDGLIRTITLYHTDGHSKFYTLRLYHMTNTALSYRVNKTWGKIGTGGRFMNSRYVNEYIANADIKIKVDSLLKKGYKLIKDEQH